MHDILSVISGCIVGFILGLIGGGGSIFAVPLLVYMVGGYSPHVVIGTSAVSVALSAVVSLFGHARQGHVKWKCAAIFTATGVLGAAVGSTIGKRVDGEKLLILFGVLMLVIAATMLFRKHREGNANTLLDRGAVARLTLTGGIVGMLSGFFGIGGGFLVVPGLMAATDMPMIYAIGSSLVSVAAFGFVTAGNYALSGLIDWKLVALFVTGSALGGFIGNLAAQKLAGDGPVLKRVFASAVTAVGIYVVFRGSYSFFQ